MTEISDALSLEFGAALFIEGERIPFGVVSLERGGGMPALTFTTPGTNELRDLPDNARVHFCTRDPVHGDWVQRFEGEITNRGTGHSTASRYVTFAAVHLTRHLNLFALPSFDVSYATAAMVQGLDQTSGSTYTVTGNVLELFEPSKMKDRVNQYFDDLKKNSPNYVLNTVEVKVKAQFAVIDPKLMKISDWILGAYFVFAARIQESRIADSYTRHALRWYRLTERFIFPRNPVVNWPDLYSNVLSQIVTQSVQQSETRITLLELIRHVASLFLYDVAILPDAGDWREQIQVKPAAHFAPIPQCNVIYPILMREFQFVEDFVNRPTRIECTLNPPKFFGDPEQVKSSLAKYFKYFAPAELQYKWEKITHEIWPKVGSGQTPPLTEQFMTNEEVHRGINATYLELPATLTQAIMQLASAPKDGVQPRLTNESDPGKQITIAASALTLDDAANRTLKYKAFLCQHLGDAGGFTDKSARLKLGHNLFRVLDDKTRQYVLKEQFEIAAPTGGNDPWQSSRRVIVMETPLKPDVPAKAGTAIAPNNDAQLIVGGAHFVIGPTGIVAQVLPRYHHLFWEPYALPFGLYIKGVGPVANLNGSIPYYGGKLRQGGNKPRMTHTKHNFEIDKYLNHEVTAVPDLLALNVSGKTNLLLINMEGAVLNLLHAPAGTTYRIVVETLQADLLNKNLVSWVVRNDLTDKDIVTRRSPDASLNPFEAPFESTNAVIIEVPGFTIPGDATMDDQNRVTSMVYPPMRVTVFVANPIGVAPTLMKPFHLMDKVTAKSSSVKPVNLLDNVWFNGVKDAGLAVTQSTPGNPGSVVIALTAGGDRVKQLEMAAWIAALVAELDSQEVPPSTGGKAISDRSPKQFKADVTSLPVFIASELYGDVSWSPPASEGDKLRSKVTEFRKTLFDLFDGQFDPKLRSGAYSTPLAAGAAAPEIVLGDAESNQLPTPQTETTTTTNNDYSYLPSANQEAKVELKEGVMEILSKLVSALTNYYYWTARYAGQATTVPMIYNPYIIPQNSCLIVDDTGAGYSVVGYVDSVKEVWNGTTGSVETLASVTHLRRIQTPGVVPIVHDRLERNDDGSLPTVGIISEKAAVLPFRANQTQNVSVLAWEYDEEGQRTSSKKENILNINSRFPQELYTRTTTRVKVLDPATKQLVDKPDNTLTPFIYDGGFGLIGKDGKTSFAEVAHYAGYRPASADDQPKTGESEEAYVLRVTEAYEKFLKFADDAIMNLDTAPESRYSFKQATLESVYSEIYRPIQRVKIAPDDLTIPDGQSETFKTLWAKKKKDMVDRFIANDSLVQFPKATVVDGLIEHPDQITIIGGDIKFVDAIKRMVAAHRQAVQDRNLLLGDGAMAGPDGAL